MGGAEEIGSPVRGDSVNEQLNEGHPDPVLGSSRPSGGA
jgi:hypothetical protein